MTKKDYLKYNNPEAYDMQGKPIKPGDTVVINNHYGSAPYVGVVDHFTQSGQLAIIYDWNNCGQTVKRRAYRVPRLVLKIKDGTESNSEDRS